MVQDGLGNLEGLVLLVVGLKGSCVLLVLLCIVELNLDDCMVT